MSLGYEPFDDDGRLMVVPKIKLPNTWPTAVTNGQARRMIDAFNESGQSNHSGSASTLWVILWWCHVHGIAYNLNAMPGMGYSVTRTGVVV